MPLPLPRFKSVPRIFDGWFEPEALRHLEREGVKPKRETVSDAVYLIYLFVFISLRSSSRRQLPLRGPFRLGPSAFEISSEAPTWLEARCGQAPLMPACAQLGHWNAAFRQFPGRAEELTLLLPPCVPSRWDHSAFL